MYKTLTPQNENSPVSDVGQYSWLQIASWSQDVGFQKVCDKRNKLSNVKNMFSSNIFLYSETLWTDLFLSKIKIKK